MLVCGSANRRPTLRFCPSRGVEGDVVGWGGGVGTDEDSGVEGEA